MAKIIAFGLVLGLAALPACGAASRLGVKVPSSPPSVTTAPSVATASSVSAAAPAAAASTAGSGSEVIPVPDFTGKTLDEARAIAKAAGFSHDVEERPMHCEGNVAKSDGRIMCQDPDAGQPARRYAGLGVAIYKEWKHEGMLVRAQLHPLIGMTPDQARARLKELGHTGKLVVMNEMQFVPKCGQNKICSIDSEAGIGVGDDLRVSINPKVEIAAPPPD